MRRVRHCSATIEVAEIVPAQFACQRTLGATTRDLRGHGAGAGGDLMQLLVELELVEHGIGYSHEQARDAGRPIASDAPLALRDAASRLVIVIHASTIDREAP